MKTTRAKSKAKFFVLGLFLLLALVMLSGCGEMTRTEQALCYSLASKSYDYIPTCETENSCYEKVDALFKTDLGYELESNLYEVKNRVARSWFFYNKAITEMKKVSTLCQSKDVSALVDSINQARLYLNNSFSELDSGVRKSFDVVTAQEKLLLEERVDLVKEESLFDSQIELEQIVSELKTGATNSDSYVSFYLKKADAFNSLGAYNGLGQLIESKSFWMQGYDYIEGTLIPKIGSGGQYFFPTLEEGLAKAFDFVENKIYSSQGLAALKQFPTSDFMRLYSNLGGASNSAFKRFVDLENRTSANLVKAKSNASTLWTEITKKSSECKVLLSEVKNNSRFDSLAAELLSGTITTQTNLEQKLTDNEKVLLGVREQKSKGALRLGEELSQLKNLSGSYAELESALTVKKESYITRLESACEDKATEIKKNYDSPSATAATNPDLERLKRDALFFASKTISSQGSEKLSYCEKMIQQSSALAEGLKDYKALKAKMQDSAKDCFAYLESVFKYADLKELSENFDELKAQEVTADNLAYFLESCESIRKQVSAELGDDSTLNEIVTAYAALKETQKKLNEVAIFLTDTSLKNKISLLGEKIAGFDYYFDSQTNSVKASEVLPIKSGLLSSMKETLTEGDSLLQEAIVSYVQKNAKIVVLSEEVPTVNTKTTSLMRLLISNPFLRLEKEITIELDYNVEDFVLNSKDPCIENISVGEKTRVALSCLPVGQTKADFSGSIVTASSEKDSFVFASNKESLLQRTISILSTKYFPRLLVQTQKPANTSKIVVLADNKELSFSNGDKNVSFVVGGASNTTKLSVFFYITGLIALEKSAINSSNTNIDERTLEYSVEATSFASEELLATLLIPLGVNTAVQSITIYDEDGTKKEHELSDTEVILRNVSFLPRETRKFDLRVTVSDRYEYYFEELTRLENELSLYNESELVLEIQKFLLIDPAAVVPTQAESLIKKATAALEVLKKQQDAQASFAAMQSKVLEQIAALEEKISEMEAAGLNKQADEARKVIETIKNTLDLNTAAGVAKAFDLLSKTTFSVDKEMSLQAETMWKKISDTNYSSSAALDSLKEKFSSEKELMDELLSSNPLEARTHFLNLKAAYDSFFETKADIDKNLAAEKASMQKQISEIATECLDMIDFLEKQLSVGEDKMVAAKIIAPITDTRLKKLKLDVTNIKSSSDPIQTRLESLLKIKTELFDAVSEIKRQCANMYNSGIESNLPVSTLAQAKKLIDSNSYISAMLVLSQGTPKAFEAIPLAGFIPIVLIVIVALVMRQKLGKKEKSEKQKQAAVLEEWKE